MSRRTWRTKHAADETNAAADLTDDELEQLSAALTGLPQQAEEAAKTLPSAPPKIVPSPEALTPWGPQGPPSPDRWVPDILDHPFEARVFSVGTDEEGEAVATLVRRKVTTGRRRRHIRFVALYLHGRNDYFFQEQAAEEFTEMGGAFYALDLRKYGRSLRPWQTIGYTDDLQVYDTDILEAIRLMRQDHPNVPLVMVGHSTGGLIATLFAWRNQDRVDALILNSAWLELQSLTAMRPALHQVISRLASVRPRATVVGKSKLNTYFRSIAGGWSDSGFQLPPELVNLEDDPAVCGWDIAPEWKLPYSYPVPAAWMQAILEGHALVEKQVHLSIPVLSLASTSSGSEEDWTPAIFSSDIVLDADILSERASGLSDHVTIERFAGKHDLFLSNPQVRTQVYRSIAQWLSFVQITD